MIFKGVITNAYLWNKSLQIEKFEEINSGEFSTTELFSWNDLDSIITNHRNDCFEKQILNQNDELFQNSFEEKIHLVEHKTTFDTSNYLCQGFGGNLLVPKDEEELITLGTLIQNSGSCRKAFVGMKKRGRDEAVDLQNNNVSFIRYVHLAYPYIQFE